MQLVVEELRHGERLLVALELPDAAQAPDRGGRIADFRTVGVLVVELVGAEHLRSLERRPTVDRVGEIAGTVAPAQRQFIALIAGLLVIHPERSRRDAGQQRQDVLHLGDGTVGERVVVVEFETQPTAEGKPLDADREFAALLETQIRVAQHLRVEPIDGVARGASEPLVVRMRAEFLAAVVPLVVIDIAVGRHRTVEVEDAALGAQFQEVDAAKVLHEILLGDDPAQTHRRRRRPAVVQQRIGSLIAASRLHEVTAVVGIAGAEAEGHLAAVLGDELLRTLGDHIGGRRGDGMAAEGAVVGELLHEIEAVGEVVEQPGLVGHRLHAVAAALLGDHRVVAVLVDALVQDVGRIVLGRTQPHEVRGVVGPVGHRRETRREEREVDVNAHVDQALADGLGIGAVFEDIGHGVLLVERRDGIPRRFQIGIVVGVDRKRDARRGVDVADDVGELGHAERGVRRGVLARIVRAVTVVGRLADAHGRDQPEARPDVAVQLDVEIGVDVHAVVVRRGTDLVDVVLAGVPQEGEVAHQVVAAARRNVGLGVIHRILEHHVAEIDARMPHVVRIVLGIGRHVVARIEHLQTAVVAGDVVQPGIIGAADILGHAIDGVHAALDVHREVTVVVAAALGPDVDDAVGGRGAVEALFEHVADDGDRLDLLGVERRLVDLHRDVIDHVHHLPAAGGDADARRGAVLADVLQRIDAGTAELLGNLDTAGQPRQGVADVGRGVFFELLAADDDRTAHRPAFLERGIGQRNVVALAGQQDRRGQRHLRRFGQGAAQSPDGREALGRNRHQIAGCDGKDDAARLIGSQVPRTLAHGEIGVRDRLPVGRDHRDGDIDPPGLRLARLRRSRAEPRREDQQHAQQRSVFGL